MPINKQTALKMLPWALLGIILLTSGVGAGKGWKYHKNALKAKNKQFDSIQKLGEERVLLYLDSMTYFQNRASEKDEEIYSLRQNNYRLYEDLKKREAQLHVIDTSFMVNAKRITRSTDRFYLSNNDPR